MCYGNPCRGQEKVLSLYLNPWFRNHRERGHCGNKCDVLQDRDGQVGVLSCRFPGESDCLDIQEEDVGEQQAHTECDEYLTDGRQ